MAGVLNVSNMIWVIFSLLALGLRGASVRRTGCSSGATQSSLLRVWCQIFSHSVLNGVFQVEDISLGLGLLPHVGVNVPQTHYTLLVAGTPHDGGEGHSVRRSQYNVERQNALKGRGYRKLTLDYCRRQSLLWSSRSHCRQPEPSFVHSSCQRKSSDSY